ncbi:MAG TPA: pyrroline-5-carboxylate reductase, partial [Nitrospirae bacterium]|nr:pyrroline-5-carboxylate reductase [Nitrospirota bacterium]
TALSGSGPAFFALFIEAMTDSGIKMGLEEKDALTLAVQTAIGTSQLLSSGMSPSAIREMVTSPGGATAAGLRVFEKKKFKDTVMSAVKAAKNRSEELGKVS